MIDQDLLLAHSSAPRSLDECVILLTGLNWPFIKAKNSLELIVLGLIESIVPISHLIMCYRAFFRSTGEVL